MRVFAVAVVISLSVLPQPSGSVVDPDAYAVYSALIPSDWLIQYAHATELLIQDTTEAENPFFKTCVPSGPGLTGAWQEALTDFNEQKATTKHLLTKFSLPVPYRLESKDTIQGFFAAAGIAGWDAFHATYPKARGYLNVSAVGFDKAHEHAFTYVGHWCGNLCGEGGYHFLERAANGWIEARLNVNNCRWAS